MRRNLCRGTDTCLRPRAILSGSGRLDAVLVPRNSVEAIDESRSVQQARPHNPNCRACNTSIDELIPNIEQLRAEAKAAGEHTARHCREVPAQEGRKRNLIPPDSISVMPMPRNIPRTVLNGIVKQFTEVRRAFGNDRDAVYSVAQRVLRLVSLEAIHKHDNEFSCSICGETVKAIKGDAYYLDHTENCPLSWIDQIRL